MPHIAHFNWATFVAPVGDPRLQDFFDAVAQVNRIAERSPGFVWRHGDEDNAARAIGWPLFHGIPQTIASFSVWQDEDSFRQFVHNTLHGTFLRRGREWFTESDSYNYVLWPVDTGHIPDIAEAREKVDTLAKDGPTPAAYTL